MTTFFVPNMTNPSNRDPNKIVLRGRGKLLQMTILSVLAMHKLLEGKDVCSLYGIPEPDPRERVTHKPIVRLYFLEPYTDRLRELDLRQATAEITFRLMSYTSQSINKAEATLIGERIKSIFGEGMGYTWEKGTVAVKYVDPHRGYHLTLNAASEAEGSRVIRSVLAIDEQPFNEQLISVTTSHKIHPVEPGRQEIYGVSVRVPRRKPTTQVRFTRADLRVEGLKKATTLFDINKKKSALVE